MRISFLKVTAAYFHTYCSFNGEKKIEIQSLPAFFLLSDEYSCVVLVSLFVFYKVNTVKCASSEIIHDMFVAFSYEDKAYRRSLDMLLLTENGFVGCKIQLSVLYKLQIF